MRDAAHALRERLKNTSVQFIAGERDKVREKRQNMVDMSDAGSKRKDDNRDNPRGGSFPSWIACRGKMGCSCVCMDLDRHGSVQTFPCKVQLLCLEVTLSSATHLSVLFFLCLGPGLVVLFWLDGFVSSGQGRPSHVAAEVGLVMFSICLCVITWHFERIDNLMKLENEIQELEKMQDQVLAQRTRVSEFFGKHQAVVQLWLYRTIPLLDLAQELFERLKDQAPGDQARFPKMLTQACVLIDEVFYRAGSVQEWLDVLERRLQEGAPDRQRGQDQRPHMVLSMWVQKQTRSGDIAALLASIEYRLPELQLEFVTPAPPPLRPGTPDSDD